MRIKEKIIFSSNWIPKNIWESTNLLYQIIRIKCYLKFSLTIQRSWPRLNRKSFSLKLHLSADKKYTNIPLQVFWYEVFYTPLFSMFSQTQHASRYELHTSNLTSPGIRIFPKGIERPSQCTMNCIQHHFVLFAVVASKYSKRTTFLKPQSFRLLIWIIKFRPKPTGLPFQLYFILLSFMRGTRACCSNWAHFFVFRNEEIPMGWKCIEKTNSPKHNVDKELN